MSPFDSFEAFLSVLMAGNYHLIKNCIKEGNQQVIAALKTDIFLQSRRHKTLGMCLKKVETALKKSDKA